MWCPLVKNEEIYSLKHDETGGALYFTNFKLLWSCPIIKDQTIGHFKALNSLYSGEDDEIYSEAIKIINNVELVTDISFPGDTECCIKYKTKVEGLRITYDITLHKSNDSTFFQEIMVPLLKTVQFLELKKNKYSEQLVKKDYELQEYRMEFGEITRRSIITEKHVEDVVKSETNLFLNLFKENVFDEAFSKNHGDLKKEHPELEVKIAKKRKLTLPKISKKQFK